MKDQIKEAIEYKELDINDYNEAWDLYDALEYDGTISEIIDGMIDIYYYDLRKWAVDNYDYVEDAMEEGLCEGVTDFHKLIQGGQYMFYREQANEDLEAVFKELKEKVEEAS